MMKKIIALMLAGGAVLATTVPADASGGCGRGFHRGPRGHCVADMRVVTPALVIGNFYTGHGYWDGRRYWPHRDRWHGGWRYR
jgi:hypothetical protein